jgi:hypothetical protein
MQTLSINDAEAQADEIEALLPWFITGRLTPSEQAYLAACMDANPSRTSHVVLAREERIISIIANEDIPGPSAAALDRLMAAIAATPQPRRWAVPSVASIWNRATAYLSNVPPRALGLAAATAMVALVAQAITIGTLLPRENAIYKSAFGDGPAKTAGGVEILVALQPGVTAAGLTSALIELNATVIDGPKGGLYRLRIGSGKVAPDVTTQITANVKAKPEVFAFVGLTASKP